MNFKSRLIGLTLLTSVSFSFVGELPIIGGVVNTGQILKERVYDGLELTYDTTVNTLGFTIGGMALETYILTLPLEAEVKKSVMLKLANPIYTVRLAHFLLMFKNRYSGLDTVESFKDYITKKYKDGDFPGVSHTLFSFVDETKVKEIESEEHSGHGIGIKPDKKLIAALVTVYHHIYKDDKLIEGQKVPDTYTYLTDSKKDLEIINKIQPIIVSLLSKVHGGMDDGDIKDALGIIISDHKNNVKFNNKAQAATITLVDFIRLNVLKGYRQFRLKGQRQLSLARFMRRKFHQDKDYLKTFLKSLNQKRFAVQVTVDGLQGNLMKGLVKGGDSRILKAIYNDEKNRVFFKPKTETVGEPEHEVKNTYLEYLVENKDIKDENYLPFFKDLYKKYSNTLSEDGISSTPTISVRNLPLIWTGANVAGDGGTSVPNFHFVDRDLDRAYYFFGNDALQLDKLLANKGTQTMFDRLNHLKTLNCNAQYDWNAHTSFDALVNLGLGETVRDFGERLCVKELRERAQVEKELVKLRSKIVSSIEDYEATPIYKPLARYTKKQVILDMIMNLAEMEDNGMPDYLLVYNPWPDHFAHFKGPFADEVLSPTGELNRLDYWLNQIQGVYKDLGIDKRTMFGMAGDHGLTPIYYFLNPEKTVFKKLEKEIGSEVKVLKISSDEGEGPKITNALSYPSNKGYDAIVASTAGGNFMIDFFHHEEDMWSKQPLYKDLLTWRALSNNEKSIDIVSEIALRLKETLDYLVVRENECSMDECEVRLVSHRNNKRIDEIVHRKGSKIAHYSKSKEALSLLDIEKENPYKEALSLKEKARKKKLIKECILSIDVKDVNTWCDESLWRELSSLTPRPDSVLQLAHLYDEDRAGTVNLFPKQGIGYNTKVPGRHAGEHFHEKDSFIGFWGLPVKNYPAKLKATGNGSLAPTLYEYLTGEEVKVNENGWGFPSVLKIK